MDLSLRTEDNLEYRFFPLSGGELRFRIKASNDAHIILTHGPKEIDPMYEIFIGGWNNNKSVIRKNKTKPEIAEINTPAILSGIEHLSFWIRWQPGVILVGMEGTETPFLFGKDYEISAFTHFGVRTGWGASGDWIIDGSSIRTARSTPIQPETTESLYWCDASDGEIPFNAIVGGKDGGEPVFIARARHEGDLIPGKLKRLDGVCYVSWDGQEHAKQNYQVLCEGQHRWVSASDGEIPPNAISGGKTEYGEPLYIGRACHNGIWTTGKIHVSHKVCYIPYDCVEMAFSNYEVLVGQ